MAAERRWLAPATKAQPCRPVPADDKDDKGLLIAGNSQFTPDGKLIIAMINEQFVRKSTSGGHHVNEKHGAKFHRTKFSADGKLLATIVDHYEGDFVRVWEIASWKSTDLRGVEDELGGLAVSSDGRFLATGSRSEAVSVWELSDVKFEAASTNTTAHK